MSLREEQCKKVCRILDNVLANRPTERDSLIVAVRKAFAEPKKIRGQWSIKGQAIDTVRGYWAKCSACGHSVFGGGNYCSNCGSYNKGEVTT